MTEKDLEQAIDRLTEIYELAMDGYGADTAGVCDRIRAMASIGIIASSLRSGLRYELGMARGRRRNAADAEDLFGPTAPEGRTISEQEIAVGV